jgi:hypothetical protein
VVETEAAGSQFTRKDRVPLWIGIAIETVIINTAPQEKTAPITVVENWLSDFTK